MKKIFYALISYLVILACSAAGFNTYIDTTAFASAGSINLPDQLSQSVILHLGCPFAYKNGQQISIDSTDAAFPFTYQDRTVVPLRFLSESFGAQVQWDPDDFAVSISIGDNVALFPLNRYYMFLNGQYTPLDIPAVELDGHTYVPLRKLVEDVLGKKVFYSNGLIIINADDSAFNQDTDTEIYDGLSFLLLNASSNHKSSLNKSLSSYLSYTGINYNNQSDYDNALKCLNNALVLDAENASANSGIGYALVEKGKPQEAIAYLDKAISLDTSNGITYHNKGYALAMLGKYEESLGFFDKALQITPQDYITYTLKGDSLTYLGKSAEAIDCYNKAIKSKPDYINAIFGKGINLYWENKLDDAIDCFSTVLTINKNDANASIWKAKCLIKTQEYDQALTLCNNVLSASPEDLSALSTKGITLASQGEFEAGIQAIDKAIEINKDYVDAYLDKVNIYYNKKDYPKCIELADTYLKLFPKNTDLIWFKADCYWDEYQYDHALEQYNIILDMYPNNESALACKAWSYFYLQDYENATVFTSEILKADPENSSALDLQKDLDDLKTPEGKRIVSFFKNNYLYMDQTKNFEQKSQELISKENISAHDVVQFVNAIKPANDKYTYVLTNTDFDSEKNESGESRFKSFNLTNNAIYIAIGSFTPATVSDFEKTIDNIENPESTTLVMDLRSNPGGDIDMANIMLDYLLPDYTTSYLVFRDGQKHEYYSDKNQVKFKKILILVDEYTASSSELLTLGLKTYLPNVTIIGHPTVGKGVGQLTFSSNAKKYMIYAVSFTWNVNGQNVTAKKITPGILVKGNGTQSYVDTVNKLLEDQ